MVIFDVKLTDDGEPVFLEVNPQGQFLFVEALCEIPLADTFAAFLVEQANQDLRYRHGGSRAQIGALGASSQPPRLDAMAPE